MASIDPGIVQQGAAGTGLPPAVVQAQIGAESGGNARAVSPAGAQGEFQFLPGTFKAQGTGGNPFNPSDEVRAYSKYMSTLLAQEHGNVRLALAAYNAGPGNVGAGLGYADKILKAAGLSAGATASGSTSRTTTYNIPGASFPTQIGGGLNKQALAEAVLKKEAQRPIDTTGKVHAGSALQDYVDAAKSGLYDSTPVSSTSALGATHGSLRTGGLQGLTGRGSNLNPLSHPDWKIRRTDMGVDANAVPGTPIEAVNDSKVVQIVPNWYKGQPLVLMQLTAGPDAGKYWYVSEQIAQIPHVGQTLARGATVAVYAPTGTGIEIGWGDPNTASRTAAGPHYTEGAVTPEGTNFLHHVLRH